MAQRLHPHDRRKIARYLPTAAVASCKHCVCLSSRNRSLEVYEQTGVRHSVLIAKKAARGDSTLRFPPTACVYIHCDQVRVCASYRTLVLTLPW